MPKVKNGLMCGVDCTLKEGCRHPMMEMEGNPETATILFVGEGPGENEDRMGIPFVGEAGKLLRDTLAMHKITNFCITNAVRCRPPKNRVPTARELQACRKLLYDDIGRINNLKLIVPLGNVALQALLKSKSISKMSGKLTIVDGRSYLPVYHPAYILRNRGELKTFQEHVGRIPQAITGALIDYTDLGVYTTITEMAQWKRLVNELIDVGYYVYDIETTDKTPFKDDVTIRCIGFSHTPRTAQVLPLDSAIWSREQWDKIYSDLRVLFESKRIGKVGHNVKFDNLFMEELLGIRVNNTIWDTKHSQFLLNENESSELKDMAWKYTKLGGYEKLLMAEPQNAEKELLYPYCATDCDITHRIYLQHKTELSRELHYLMTNLMIPTTNALVGLERRGIGLDLAKLDICEDAVDEMLSTLDKSIRSEKSIQDFEAMQGAPFNPNSYLQLGEVLFKYEGLKSLSSTKKTRLPSTSRAVLEALASQSNLCKLLSEHSLYQSMKSKMIKELREYAYKGRIHTFYLQTRAVTGRTSSKTPNMQNVTKGDKDVVGIRNVFIADPGFRLAEFDYNQHELRCMAEEAGDAVLAAAITTDVHAATAASILGIPREQVTPDQRRNIGKTFNFGLIYGLTDHGVMDRLKCSELQAKMYIDRFFQTYAKTKQWMDRTAAFARKNGYVTSRTGRVRHFPIWDELDEKSVREAINMPIQSLASDILLYGMIAVSRLLSNRKSYICLEIHDSLVCNIHEDEMELIPIIQDTLAKACLKHIRFTIPLEVDVKIGQSWGELREHGSSKE